MFCMKCIDIGSCPERNEFSCSGGVISFGNLNFTRTPTGITRLTGGIFNNIHDPTSKLTSNPTNHGLTSKLLLKQRPSASSNSFFSILKQTKTINQITFSVTCFSF